MPAFLASVGLAVQVDLLEVVEPIAKGRPMSLSMSAFQCLDANSPSPSKPARVKASRELVLVEEYTQDKPPIRSLAMALRWRPLGVVAAQPMMRWRRGRLRMQRVALSG